MGVDKHILIYQAKIPFWVMELKHYGGRNKEVKEGDEIIVSEAEKRYLLKLTNGRKSKGGKPIFRLKQERKANKEEGET